MTSPALPETPLPHSGLVDLLTSPDARAALDQLVGSTTADPVTAATQLRKRFVPDIVAAVLTLHELRSRAAVTRKFSHAKAMLLTRAGYEQASSEGIARWRARRFAGSSAIADLCCGIGGDLMALAELPSLARLTAVDLDADHLAMALANARLIAPNGPIAAMHADVRDIDLTDMDGVFIDPARRDAGGRFAHGETEPPLDWCLELAGRIPRVGIKLAPGIDHNRVPPGWELETIAIDTDLKEAVLWSPALATAARRATVIRDGEAFSMTGAGDEADALPPLTTPEAGQWLHDPNPAVTRAGLVQSLGAAIDARQVDHQIAFLISDTPVRTPFARSRQIIASQPWDERELRKTLAALNAGAIDIRRRGLAGDVDTIAKRLRKTLPKAGGRALWIAMTRTDDRPWAIVCAETPDTSADGIPAR
ncbi:MAG: class I SAM-dependent methyltransferase [Thermomicrobiales bacterium]